MQGERRNKGLLLPVFFLLSPCFFSIPVMLGFSFQQDQFFPGAAFESSFLFFKHQPEVDSSALQLSSRSGILAMVCKLIWLWNPLGEQFIQTVFHEIHLFSTT